MTVLIRVLAAVLGSSSLLGFATFLYLGSISLTEIEIGTGARLAWNGVLCGVFFVQHSGMIRQPFRRRLTRLVPVRYHGALYSIASAFALLPLLTLWQRSHLTLVELGGPVRWVMRALFGTAVVAFAWGVRSLGSLDAFGSQPLRRLSQKWPPRPMALTIRGPYRWVRHPLYSSVLVMIWTCPSLTADRLLFNVLWTGWVVAGTVLEERDLVAELGDAYRDYQRKVPMLVPRSVRPRQWPQRDGTRARLGPHG